jgi:ankyrin repeat protein
MRTRANAGVLHCAVASGNVDAVRSLLSIRTDMSGGGADDYGAGERMATVEEVTAGLAAGVAGGADSGVSPPSQALVVDPAAMRLLDSRDSDGLTPLLLAAREGSAEVLRLLVGAHPGSGVGGVGRGAVLNAADDSGFTALHWLYSSDHLELGDWLAAAGADASLADEGVSLSWGGLGWSRGREGVRFREMRQCPTVDFFAGKDGGGLAGGASS